VKAKKPPKNGREVLRARDEVRLEPYRVGPPVRRSEPSEQLRIMTAISIARDSSRDRNADGPERDVIVGSRRHRRCSAPRKRRHPCSPIVVQRELVAFGDLDAADEAFRFAYGACIRPVTPSEGSPERRRKQRVEIVLEPSQFVGMFEEREHPTPTALRSCRRRR